MKKIAKLILGIGILTLPLSTYGQEKENSGVVAPDVLKDAVNKPAVSADKEEVKTPSTANNDIKSVSTTSETAKKEIHNKSETPVSKDVVKKNESPSEWKLVISGFVRGDFSFNSGHIFSLDSPLFAHNDSDFRETGMSFTGRLSRIRLTGNAPKIGDNWQPYGVIEGDFFGNLPASGTSIRQAQFRMRLAYAAIKNDQMDIHFGNDWMVAAPLFASALEPFNLWGQGNIWMRYPQLNIRTKFQAHKNANVQIAASVGHNMGGDAPKSEPLLQGGIGENSGLPVFQARLGFGLKFEDVSLDAGVSGSWQKIKFSESGDVSIQDAFAGSPDDEQNVYFISADTVFNMKINKTVNIKLSGEYYKGQGTSMYWGAILIGPAILDTTGGSGNGTATMVRSQGFFGDLKVSLPANFGVFAGFGMDIVNEDDISSDTRSKNRMIYGGATYSFMSGKKPVLILGASFANLTTSYKDADDGKANLVHFMASVPF
ncbi:MAG: hypothetical protein JXR95_11725 [Deltaproteobacteria bacterium]|nr:hypothetical protein [Deltaproteobacteria bacterium]